MTVHALIGQQGNQTSGYAGHRAGIAAALQKGAHRTALTYLHALHGSFPTDPQLLDDMATCYWALGDHTAAVKLTEFVAQELGTNALAWGKLGAMALSTGDEQRAETAFRKTLGINPGDVRALAALNRIAVFKRNGSRASTLKKTARSRKASLADRALAFNALGRIEDAGGNTKAAFFNFSKSKSLSPGTYDSQAVNQQVDQQIRTFKPVTGSAVSQDQGPRFVFVVGMPRSGTTLVESIVLRHPDVSTIGESSALQDLLNQYRRKCGATHSWDWFERLTDGDADALRARYVRSCAQQFAQDLPPVIIDKTPLNIFELGFAARVLPSARFVFLSRHPLDVGLSAFATHFFAAHPYSNSLASIGDMTRAVYRSADNYERRLGPAFRRQSYAALVSSPETQIRSLLDHLGLAWNPACLSPQDRVGMVRTASVTQVRAPITRSAIGKWTRYEKELQPLVKALGGPDWIDDWERADQAAG